MRRLSGLILGLGLIALAASTPAKAITVNSACAACPTYAVGTGDGYFTQISGSSSFFLQFMVSTAGTLSFINGEANNGFADTTITSVSFTNFSGGPAPNQLSSTVTNLAQTSAGDDRFAGLWSGLLPGNVYQLVVSYVVAPVGATNFDFFSGTLAFAAPVPLPAPLLLLGAALVGVGAISRRRKPPAA